MMAQPNPVAMTPAPLPSVNGIVLIDDGESPSPGELRQRASTELDDEACRRYYKGHREQLERGERLHVRHVIVRGDSRSGRERPPQAGRSLPAGP